MENNDLPFTFGRISLLQPQTVVLQLRERDCYMYEELFSPPACSSVQMLTGLDASVLQTISHTCHF